jgi:hypothetical protein
LLETCRPGVFSFPHFSISPKSFCTRNVTCGTNPLGTVQVQREMEKVEKRKLRGDTFPATRCTKFLTLHSFSVTLFTLGLRLFYSVANKHTGTQKATRVCKQSPIFYLTYYYILRQKEGASNCVTPRRCHHEHVDVCTRHVVLHLKYQLPGHPWVTVGGYMTVTEKILTSHCSVDLQTKVGPPTVMQIVINISIGIQIVLFRGLSSVIGSPSNVRFSASLCSSTETSHVVFRPFLRA